MTSARWYEKPAKPDEAFGRAVHMAMFDRRVTQASMAKRTGIEQSLLSKKLHGVRPWSLGDMILVADALQLDLRDILGEMWRGPGSPTAKAADPTRPKFSPKIATISARPELSDPMRGHLLAV